MIDWVNNEGPGGRNEQAEALGSHCKIYISVRKPQRIANLSEMGQTQDQRPKGIEG